jgi:hypothetical protein
MIIRADEGGLVLIRQTEHARLCGDMARTWGNGRFAPVRPLEAVAWAAAKHDNGWAEWEDAPRLNPRTGRPYTYTDIPIDQHLEITRRSIARAIARNPYAGLLVSLHGSILYGRFRYRQPGAGAFLEEQGGVQGRLVAAMGVDPAFGPFCEEPALATNRDLVFAWDSLSLFLCHGAAWVPQLEVPCDYAGGRVRVDSRQGADGWTLDPYPFRQDPLALSAAALRTRRTEFAAESELRAALERAERLRLDVVIRGLQQ